MREILTIESGGAVLHGTMHTAAAGHPTGILFLNSGAQPRCSRGDLNAHLADSLAERGFPCFRIDLPGLGDSQGELPQDFAKFYQLVQAGAYAACTRKIATVLRERYDLAGIVLLGICGGALSAVFAAAASDKRDGAAGLVLLDLPFTFVSVRSGANTPGRQVPESVLTRARARAKRWKSALHDWVLAQKWEPYATWLYHRLQKLRLSTSARGLSIPANTNHPLLDALCGVLKEGAPALFITAHPTPEPPTFDFLAHVGRRSGQVIEHVKIPGPASFLR